MLVTGAAGQLGSSLLRQVPPGAEVVGLDRAALDVGDRDAVARAMAAHRPDVVVNAAAYTSVDRAEAEPAEAYRINAEGPANLAEIARDAGARLVHVSTDFVFAGRQAIPYGIDDEPEPLSTYGQSKLAGERAVAKILGTRAAIVRTSWVYAARGRNFVSTMLGLMRARSSLSVVYDQVGRPTWATSLAMALWRICGLEEPGGIHHWADAGVASWYDFAVAIQEEALSRRLLETAIPIRPVRTSEYPTSARRPAYSVLDTASTSSAIGCEPRHWRTNLRAMLDELGKT